MEQQPNDKSDRSISRRKFLAGTAVGAALAPLTAGLAGRSPAPAVANDLCYINVSSQLLLPTDFNYLGHYDLETEGANSAFLKGFTHRYVNGDLRFLCSGSGNWVIEFSLAGQSFGGTITNRTNVWEPAWDPSLFSLLFPSEALGWSHYIWWDEAQARLWSLSAPGYTALVYPVKLVTRTLNSNGTVSNIKSLGVQGLGAKKIFGGACAVPPSFQQQYGVGPYMIGWGGYQSLMAQGTHVSLGPAAYAIGDPANYANNTDITSVRSVMDCSAAAGQGDWYASSRPSSYDRGVRVTRPVNEFDEGLWRSPAPDGLGRMTWGDSYYNTGCWIDGPNKRGFVMIASLGGGRCWYYNSTLNYERRQFELHIFDPAHMGEAVRGTRPVWDVRPINPVELTFNGLGAGGQGNGEYGNIAGATYDPVTKRLFLLGPAGAGPTRSRIYVYSVNA